MRRVAGPGSDRRNALPRVARARPAPGFTVGIECQQLAAAAFPQVQQRVLEQRQAARLGGGIGEDRVRQPLFELKANEPGGLLDRL